MCKSVDGVKDVASSIFPDSFDFGKFASAVDEQISSLRDFVESAAGKAEPTKKRRLKIPQRHLLDPFDSEDVAIEVEYVDDEDDESSSQSVDNEPNAFDDPFGEAFDKKAMQYVEEAAPAGEPSYERPNPRRSREQNDGRRRYV